MVFTLPAVRRRQDRACLDRALRRDAVLFSHSRVHEGVHCSLGYCFSGNAMVPHPSIARQPFSDAGADDELG
jgi:hypothetical protein